LPPRRFISPTADAATTAVFSQAAIDYYFLLRCSAPIAAAISAFSHGISIAFH
jgi:hypothetical protein